MDKLLVCNSLDLHFREGMNKKLMEELKKLKGYGVIIVNFMFCAKSDFILMTVKFYFIITVI